jgi:hypothetical protein
VYADHGRRCPSPLKRNGGIEVSACLALIIHFRPHVNKMQSGIHTRYWWLETDHSLREFLPVCPAVIVGRHIAITAVDSGCFNPSDDDRAAGWNATGGIAYSPRLESVAALPSDCCCGHGGFDEWYVFGVEPPVLGAICHANVFEKAIASPNVFQFINFYGFQLSNAHMKALADLFWTQMEWVRPNPTSVTVTVA